MLYLVAVQFVNGDEIGSKTYYYSTTLNLVEGAKYYIENENGYKYNSPVVVKGFKPVNASASIKKLHDDYVTHRITKADIVGVSVKRPNDKIKGVWFNKEKRTTVVKWFDDTVTKVTAAVNDEFNMECGLAMCYMKRWSFDNRGCFNETFKKWIPKEEVEENIKEDNE